MLILGIDPGTATTGYGFIKVDGPSFSVVEYGLIETLKTSDPEKRLQEIFHDMTILIDKHKPDIAAIEKVFFATNAKTAIRVGQSIGVIMLAAAQAEIPVIEYSPMTVKKMISGNGRADKTFVQKHVQKLLHIAKPKKGEKTHFDNSADALAIAICHIYSSNAEGLAHIKSHIKL